MLLQMTVSAWTTPLNFDIPASTLTIPAETLTCEALTVTFAAAVIVIGIAELPVIQGHLASAPQHQHVVSLEANGGPRTLHPALRY